MERETASQLPSPQRTFLPSSLSRGTSVLRPEMSKVATESQRTFTTAATSASAGVLAQPWVRAALPFVNGGISGMVATAVIQPIDMVKVRLQLASSAGVRPSPLSITRDIISSGKFLDLYAGLSAGLLRQAVYTTARIGFFETFMKELKGRGEVGFKERAGAGLLAGGLAAMLGNPADLALIRMQADGLKPAALRSNYTSVIHALTSITRAEGVLSLWNGATPTIIRAMALNFGQLAFFSEAKTQLKTLQSQGYHNLGVTGQTLLASGVAGFFASFFSLPFDFLKTRMQNAKKVEGGGKPLGMMGTAVKVVREEGIGRFYRGFGTYYVRIAPHAMVTLLVADYLGILTKA